MADSSTPIGNSKIVFQSKQLNLNPNLGEATLSASVNFDFTPTDPTDLGTILMFTYGLNGFNFTFNDYVQDFSIQPVVTHLGSSNIEIKVTVNFSNANGLIDVTDNPWVSIVVIAYVASSLGSDALLTNVGNIPDGSTEDAGNNGLIQGSVEAYPILAGFNFTASKNPLAIENPTIVSMNASIGVELPTDNSGTSNFGLNSSAMMVNGDTANYGKIQAHTHPGSIDAGLFALASGFEDNNLMIVRAQRLSFDGNTPKDKDGNLVLPMPDFDVDSSKYKLVDYVLVFQNFQISKEADNLYEYKNGQFGLNVWGSPGDAPTEITFYSYFSLINPEGTVLSNIGAADILVIALFQQLSPVLVKQD